MRLGRLSCRLPPVGFPHRHALAIPGEDQHAAGVLRLLGRGAAPGVVKGPKVLRRTRHHLFRLTLGYVRSRGRRDGIGSEDPVDAGDLSVSIKQPGSCADSNQRADVVK